MAKIGSDESITREEYVAIPKEEALRIGAILKERGALNPCPRCSKEEWKGPVYGSQPMENAVNRQGFMGPFMGTVKLYCEHCGFISEHFLLPLGLIPEGEASGA